MFPRVKLAFNRWFSTFSSRSSFSVKFSLTVARVRMRLARSATRSLIKSSKEKHFYLFIFAKELWVNLKTVAESR